VLTDDNTKDDITEICDVIKKIADKRRKRERKYITKESQQTMGTIHKALERKLKKFKTDMNDDLRPLNQKIEQEASNLEKLSKDLIAHSSTYMNVVGNFNSDFQKSAAHIKDIQRQLVENKRKRMETLATLARQCKSGVTKGAKELDAKVSAHRNRAKGSGQSMLGSLTKLLAF
jgi:gas vesicle protein